MRFVFTIFTIAFFFFAFIVIAQWLWSVFCPVFFFFEMSFWQMASFILFIAMFIAPRFVKK